MTADPEVVLETERLLLRRFREDDWKALQDYVSLPEVTKYDFDYPTSDEACRELALYFAGRQDTWAVCLQGSGRLVGHIVSNRVAPPDILTWDIGFIFNPAFASRGYATESCRAVLGHIFAVLGAHRVESHCHPDNAASWRLLQRLGMRREGHHIQSVFLRRTQDGSPIWIDSLDYAILRDEWQQHREHLGHQ